MALGDARAPCRLTADAGFAGVGGYGLGSKDEPLEVVIGRAGGPDFEREWAVLGSNQ